METIEGLTRSYRILEQKINRFEKCLEAASPSDKGCCTEVQGSFKALRERVQNLRTDLKTFGTTIATLSPGSHYSESVMQSAMKCNGELEEAIQIHGYIVYHTKICKEKFYNTTIHAIQKFQNECLHLLTLIRPSLPKYPTLLVPYGYTPNAYIHTAPICVTTVPCIDLYCPLSWGTLAHEIAHTAIRGIPKTNREQHILELKCDFWATILVGPAFPIAFSLAYGSLPSKARYKEIKPSHPFSETRLRFCERVLMEGLGYPKDFIESIEKHYHYLFDYEPSTDVKTGISEIDKETAELMNEVMSLLSTPMIKEGVTTYGFTWDTWTDTHGGKNGAAGIAEQLKKGRPLHARLVRDLLNGLTYHILEDKQANIHDEKLLAILLESINNSQDASVMYPAR